MEITITGVWLAFYSDYSSVAVFNNELDALRYAISRGMQVLHVPYGMTIAEAIGEFGVPTSHDSATGA